MKNGFESGVVAETTRRSGKGGVVLKFPRTLEEYWGLPREVRKELYEKFGFGWKTLVGGGLAVPGKSETLGQGELFDFIEEDEKNA